MLLLSLSYNLLTYYSIPVLDFNFISEIIFGVNGKTFLPRSGVGFITGTFFSSVQYTLNWDSLEHKESYHTSPIIQAAVVVV